MKLVDRLGGVKEALEETAMLLEVESAKDLAVFEFPPEKPPLQQVLELLEKGVSAPAALSHIMQQAVAPYTQKGATTAPFVGIEL